MKIKCECRCEYTLKLNEKKKRSMPITRQHVSKYFEKVAKRRSFMNEGRLSKWIIVHWMDGKHITYYR